LRCEVHHSITSSAESEQRCRHLDAERLGGFQLDDEREPGRLHDRQIGGLGALGDAAGIGASLDALSYASGFLDGSLLAGAQGDQNEKSPGTRRSSFMQRIKNSDLSGRLLPRRTTVAPQLIADPRIGVGAETLACLVIPDTRDVLVRLSRGIVVRLRAGLRNRRSCHESGKGDGG
jgi:hypothetical protein